MYLFDTFSILTKNEREQKILKVTFIQYLD